MIKSEKLELSANLFEKIKKFIYFLTCLVIYFLTCLVNINNRMYFKKQKYNLLLLSHKTAIYKDKLIKNIICFT